MIGKLQSSLCACTDVRGIVRKVNEELERAWEEQTGCSRQLVQKVESIDLKITNIRRAVEDGLGDAAWANQRLQELMAEKESLTATQTLAGVPPRINVDKVEGYRRQLAKIALEDDPAECKKLIRECVLEMQLAPDRYEVDVTFTIPEPFVHSVVAGARYLPLHIRAAFWKKFQFAA